MQDSGASGYLHYSTRFAIFRHRNALNLFLSFPPSLHSPTFSVLSCDQSIQSNCVLIFNASFSSGWYGVALIVEDFPSPTSMVAKSKVPLQFLVNVYSSPDACTATPELIAPSPAQGQCYGLAPGSMFNLQMRAKAASATWVRQVLSWGTACGQNSFIKEVKHS